MIEALYRTALGAIAPRSPRPLTATEKGCFVQPVVEKPDQDFQNAGIELVWPADYTVGVNSDLSLDLQVHRKCVEPPKVIQTHGDEYYTVETGQHVVLPPGFQGLVLPYHRFFDPVPPGAFTDIPAIIPRIVALDYWPLPITLLCRRPQPGTQHYFYAGEPFCQIIPIPRSEIAIQPMDDAEARVWQDREDFLRTREKQIGYESFLQHVRKLGWITLAQEYPKADQ